MADIKAAKTELLRVADGQEPAQSEVARDDMLDRILKKYFNAASQDERHIEAKRMGIIMRPDETAETAAALVHALLKKYGSPV